MPVAAGPPSSRSASMVIHRGLAEGAVAAGAVTIVAVFHSCHRALAGAEGVYPQLKVVNFTDVLAEALGRGGSDRLLHSPLQAESCALLMSPVRCNSTSHGSSVHTRSRWSRTAGYHAEYRAHSMRGGTRGHKVRNRIAQQQASRRSRSTLSQTRQQEGVDDRCP